MRPLSSEIYFKDLNRLVNLISTLFDKDYFLEGDKSIFKFGDFQIICCESKIKNNKNIFFVEDFSYEELEQKCEFFNYSSQEKLTLNKTEKSFELILDRIYLFSVICDVRNY